MSDTTSGSRSRKSIVTSLTLASVLAVTYPAIPAKVYATGNAYEWVKHEDHDLLGGYYTSVASSASGQHLIVASTDGGESYDMEDPLLPSPLYVSDDYGTTWEDVTEEADEGIRNYWMSVDVSNDGQTMVAASEEGRELDTTTFVDGKIFISQDAGDSWEDISPEDADDWEHVVVSGDGNTIAAVTDDDSDLVYISEDSGDTWQTSEVDIDMWQWDSLSISDDGNTILFGGESSDTGSSAVFISDDGGDAWEDITPEYEYWGEQVKTAMSADGSKIAVALFGSDGGENDNVYISDDAGASWTDVTPDDEDDNEWNAIAMSDDGKMLAVLDPNYDRMYISSDDGANWNEEDPALEDNDDYWTSIDFNASGSRIIVASEEFAYSGYNASLGRTVKFASAENGKPIVLTLPSGTTLTCHSPVKESGLSAQDGVYSYPLGLVDFCFSGADADNEVSLIFVTDLKPNEVAVRKYNPNSKEYATVTGASITETTYEGDHALRVTYTITDNGPLDTDSDVGEIADPVGLAVLGVGAPNTGLAPQDTAPLAVLAAVTIGTSLIALPIRRKVFSHLASKK